MFSGRTNGPAISVIRLRVIPRDGKPSRDDTWARTHRTGEDDVALGLDAPKTFRAHLKMVFELFIV